MKGKADRAFHDEHKNEGHQADTESWTRQGWQRESIDDPPRADHGGEQHVGNFQHLSKSLADMQRHDLQANDLQHTFRSDCNQEVERAGFQNLHEAIRSFTVGCLVRYGSHEIRRILMLYRRLRLLVLQVQRASCSIRWISLAENDRDIYGWKSMDAYRTTFTGWRRKRGSGKNKRNESAFPVISDEKRHDHQHTQRTERQCADDGTLNSEVLSQRESMQRQDDHAFHENHETQSHRTDS